MNNFTKNLALWVIIGLLLIALFNLFQNPSEPKSTQSNLSYSEFLERGRRRPDQRCHDPGQDHQRPLTPTAVRSAPMSPPEDPNLVADACAIAA